MILLIIDEKTARFFPKCCLLLYIYSKYNHCVSLTLIHKHQSDLVLGTTVPQLRRVWALVLLRELVNSYLHQTFGLVEADLTVLQERKHVHAHSSYTDDPRWQVDATIKRFYREYNVNLFTTREMTSAL